MKVHFIGCEGVSMRRLMRLTAALGHSVSGSDKATTGHNAAFVKNAQLAVFSGAVSPSNPELEFARANGIPTIERGDFLGAIASGYKKTVAVAGTHGKTTVTAMLASALSTLSPTMHIGAEGEFGGDGKELFITEACEYRRSLLALSPTLSVVLNAELDHPDCYRSATEIAGVFGRLARKSDSVLYNADDSLLRSVMPVSARTFGESAGCDFRAADLRRENGCFSFDFLASGISLGRVRLAVVGRHNAINALSALGASLMLGVPFSVAKGGVEKFTGVTRRQELLGRIGSTLFYTDYAHHPTEIAATIDALKNGGKTLVVFEPHTFTRTRTLAKQFSTAFRSADEVVLAPVFASREAPSDFSSDDLCSLVHKYTPCRCFDSYAHICTYLSTVYSRFGTVIFMGAGSIDKCAREFVLGSGG